MNPLPSATPLAWAERPARSFATQFRTLAEKVAAQKVVLDIEILDFERRGGKSTTQLLVIPQTGAKSTGDSNFTELSAFVKPTDSEAIDRFVQRNGFEGLADFFRVGTRVRVSGHFVVSRVTKAVSLQIEKVSPKRLGDGEFTQWRAEQLRLAQEQELLTNTSETVYAASNDFLKLRNTITAQRALVLGRPSLHASADIVNASHGKFPFDYADVPMQGRDAIKMMVNALSEVDKETHGVVIIARGGGAETDLSIFDNIALLQAVKACPVPVLTAIGHAKNLPLINRVADFACAVPADIGKNLYRAFSSPEPDPSQLATGAFKVAAATDDSDARRPSLATQELETLRHTLEDAEALRTESDEALSKANDEIARLNARIENLEQENQSLQVSASAMGHSAPVVPLTQFQQLRAGARRKLWSVGAVLGVVGVALGLAIATLF